MTELILEQLLNRRNAEKTISSEAVYGGRVLKVRRDRVQLSNGLESVREYVEHPGAVILVPRLPHGRTLVVSQYRYPVRQNVIEFPAGKMEPGEAPEITARRELIEETGYEAGALRQIYSWRPSVATSTEIIQVYEATDLKFVGQNCEEGEILECVPISIDELVELMRQGHIIDPKTHLLIHWLDANR